MEKKTEKNNYDLTKDLFFDLRQVHHIYKAIFKIFLIVSPKGIGKSYSAIKLCIENWEKFGKSFAYVFRYFVEATVFLNEFKSYLDLSKYTIKTSNISATIYDKIGQIVGVIYGLNQAHYIKNIQNVNLIIFDEFISARHQYLTNEMKKFYLMISNLIRNKKYWNLYMLGNYHNVQNPYWNYFKMWRWKQRDIWNPQILYDKQIAYWGIIQQDFPLIISQQQANILQEYDSNESLAIYKQGGFSNNSMHLILNEDVNYDYLKCAHGFMTDNITIYVWKFHDKLLFSSHKPKTHVFTFALNHLTLLDNTIKLDNDDIGIFEWWKNMIQHNKALFENFDIKNIVIDKITRVYEVWKT